jgi:hypothetical protein
MRCSPLVSALALFAALAALPLCGQEQPVGELFAADASVTGGVMLTGSGTQVLGGSEVRAGDSTAVLRLTRGGDVRICPRTAVSVTSARDGRGLMLAMSTGAMETRYSLPALSDSILTPDFRISLTGPGRFHFAISADARGNTCVRALPQNTAAVIVSELMGSGQYQVKASEQVVFREGGMAQVDSATPADCGCPPPLQLERAQAPPEPPATAIAQGMRPAASAAEAAPAGEAELPAHPIPAAARPPLRSGQVHIEVDAPFVFRAEEMAGAAAPGPPADPLAARLRVRISPPPLSLVRPPPAVVRASQAPPPERHKSAEKKGFFRRLGAALGALFKGGGG